MGDDDLELLKVGVKAGVENALRPFGRLIEKLFGGAAEQLGGMLTDTLAFQRQARQIVFFKKLQAAVENAGFEPQKIPDKIWLPALQHALLEDDETLQESWANLLANAADPRQINPVLPSFSQIMKEFTPREARFLDALYEHLSSRTSPRGRLPFDRMFTRGDLSNVYVSAGLSRRTQLMNLTDAQVREGGDDLQSDLSDFATTIDVLVRNGILRESTTPNPIDVSKIVSDSKFTKGLPRSIEAKVTTRYHLTDLGTQFVRACKAPSSGQPEAGPQ